MIRAEIAEIDKQIHQLELRQIALRKEIEYAERVRGLMRLDMNPKESKPLAELKVEAAALSSQINYLRSDQPPVVVPMIS